MQKLTKIIKSAINGWLPCHIADEVTRRIVKRLAEEGYIFEQESCNFY